MGENETPERERLSFEPLSALALFSSNFGARRGSESTHTAHRVRSGGTPEGGL